MNQNQKRYGFVGLILKDNSHAVAVQEILSSHSNLILGRMGLPHLENDQLSVITLIVCGSTDDIGAMTGKLGALAGVSVKSGLHKLAAGSGE